MRALLRQGLLFARSPHTLRWRLETFGLYMPSLPETRPWWRINARVARTLVTQLPGYIRWLTEMAQARHGGAAGFWRARAGTSLQDWDRWLGASE